jgi:hypothetical protein
LVEAASSFYVNVLREEAKEDEKKKIIKINSHFEE